MMQSKPDATPFGSQTAASAYSGEGARPSGAPPAAAVSSSGGCGCSGAVGAGPAFPVGGAMGDAAPSVAPSDGLGGIAAWLNNKRITGLWSINQNRNAFVHVDGVGWKKLSNNGDSTVVALNVLGSHAREKGSVVNYREESDGMIHEIYVW